MAVQIIRFQKNPLDWAIGMLGMTRTEFQVECGFSKPYLLRLSQGRQSQMSERVISALYRLASEKGIDLDSEIIGQYGPATSVAEAYDWWIAEHRRRQRMPAPASAPNENPFVRLILSVGSMSRMSALLAAPDTLVERYAKGVSYEMPEPVREALEGMGYPHIESLEKSMRRWGKNHA